MENKLYHQFSFWAAILFLGIGIYGMIEDNYVSSFINILFGFLNLILAELGVIRCDLRDLKEGR